MTIVVQEIQQPDVGTISDGQNRPQRAASERLRPIIDIKFADDISIHNGDLATLEEPDASGQRIRHRLLTFKNEWFLDLSFGPDYRAQVFVKNPRIEVVSALLRAEIVKSAPGTFTSFEASFNNPARRLTLQYALELPQGTVTETITI